MRSDLSRLILSTPKKLFPDQYEKTQTGNGIRRLFIGFLSHWQPDENDKSRKKKTNELIPIIIFTVQVSL